MRKSELTKILFTILNKEHTRAGVIKKVSSVVELGIQTILQKANY